MLLHRIYLLSRAIPLLLFLSPATSFAKTGIFNTVHNLSAWGPGQYKALTETQVCIFCHTPHNATPMTPLWNKAIEPVNYRLYESSTLTAPLGQPTGPTRLCLSCHDGTIALGDVHKPAGGIAMAREFSAGSKLIIGTDISDDHPVSFSYHSSLPNEELNPSLPAGLLFYDGGNIHCSTCHDPHDNTYGKFLAVDNIYSALCTKCHNLKGWQTASHQHSTAVWNNSGPNPWPHNLRHSAASQWMTVAENGCQNCHQPHSTGGPKRLLNYLAEEENCYPCHNGNVASQNIQGEMQKYSRHPVSSTTIGITANSHDPAESSFTSYNHVECADCHNPHAVNNQTAAPPRISGALSRVSGIDQNGSPIDPAVNQYEICYKCHADLNETPPYVARVLNQNNTRLEFDPFNPSYHPVARSGQNSDVPSIPSTLAPALTASSLIYCTDCHESDESPAVGGTGPKGPHGSIFPPILRERYETADHTMESYQNYALCYRCHQRESILADQSFRKKSFGRTFSRGGHSGHLADGAPCSACHDPHGVQSDGFTGDHTHLINFDTLIAQSAAGQTAPFFTDNSNGAGSCTLVCHGKTHTPGYAGSDLNTVDSMYP